MLEILTFGELPVDTQDELAKKISHYTNGLAGEQPQMLPVELEEVLGRVGQVAFWDQEFAGYIAALDPISHKSQLMCEVGTLWVPTEYRGRKIATALSLRISSLLEQSDTTPYVFCNPLSRGVFMAAGFTVAACSDVPPVAFDACAACPSKPVAGCCDTVLVKLAKREVKQ